MAFFQTVSLTLSKLTFFFFILKRIDRRTTRKTNLKNNNKPINERDYSFAIEFVAIEKNHRIDKHRKVVFNPRQKLNVDCF